MADATKIALLALAFGVLFLAGVLTANLLNTPSGQYVQQPSQSYGAAMQKPNQPSSATAHLIINMLPRDSEVNP